MADQFCPSCGTEVDEDARFCPSCGQTLDLPGDDAAEQLDLPAAPAWPEPASVAAATPGKPQAAEPVQEAPATGDAAGDEPTRPTHPTGSGEPPAEPPPPRPDPAPPPGGAAASAAPAQPSQPVELPFSWPTSIAGWLIGGGSIGGAAALVPSLGDLVSVFLFLALLAVAATVFLADRLPEIPRLRLLVLLVTMIGLGIALDRAAFTVRGIETVLLIAMLAAAGGALLIELDRDRPVPPPGRVGG